MHITVPFKQLGRAYRSVCRLGFLSSITLLTTHFVAFEVLAAVGLAFLRYIYATQISCYGCLCVVEWVFAINVVE